MANARILSPAEARQEDLNRKYRPLGSYILNWDQEFWTKENLDRVLDNLPPGAILMFTTNSIQAYALRETA